MFVLVSGFIQLALPCDNFSLSLRVCFHLLFALVPWLAPLALLTPAFSELVVSSVDSVPSISSVYFPSGRVVQLHLAVFLFHI